MKNRSGEMYQIRADDRMDERERSTEESVALVSNLNSANSSLSTFCLFTDLGSKKEREDAQRKERQENRP